MNLLNIKKYYFLLCVALFSTAIFADSDFNPERSPENVDLFVTQTTKSINKSKHSKIKNEMVLEPDTWKPYIIKTKAIESVPSSFYQQTLGVGFLYFSGIKGNLQPCNNSSYLKTKKKVSGHLGYNRTPIAEFIIGTNLLHWWKMALSYQHQGGVVLQASPQPAVLVPGATAQSPNDLTGYLSFDALMLKFYFTLPYSLVWKSVYYEPYFGIGVGPGWITATDVRDAVFNRALRQQESANCVYNLDLGFKLRKALPHYILSFTIGCKYNQWGQLRSLGKQNQQYASSVDITAGHNGQRTALSNPLRIKTIYQFAPYIGVGFNF